MMGTEVRELTFEEGREYFEQQARRLLDISGDEFLRKYEAGELDAEDTRVARLLLLRPFAR